MLLFIIDCLLNISSIKVLSISFEEANALAIPFLYSYFLIVYPSQFSVFIKDPGNLLIQKLIRIE